MALNLNISNISEGRTCFSVSIKASEIDLRKDEGFESPVDINFEMDKVGQDFYIKSTVITKVCLSCDRCLDNFNLDLKEKIDIIFTTDDNVAEREQDDIYKISASDSKVDITESVRQSLLLAIPLKKLCKEECKGLCPKCGTNINIEKCNCDNSYIDPRWETLKEIKFEN